MRVDATDGPKLISDRAAFKDGQVGVELKFEDRKGQNAGLIVRVDKPGIGADRFVGYEISLDPGRQILGLARHRNNFEPIKNVNAKWRSGVGFPLEVKLAGSIIEIFVDGKSLLRHDDGDKALPSGSVGLRGWHCQASFRNLWVKTGRESRAVGLQADRNSHGSQRHVAAGAPRHRHGQFAIVKDHPFAGTQSQRFSFASGEGELGVGEPGAQSLGHELCRGQAYEGYVWVRAEKPATLFASLESRDGSQNLRRDQVGCHDRKIGNAWISL